MKSDKEYLIKLISRTLIEKGMDKKNIKVFDDNPVMLFNKLIERFELIDKLSSVTNASISNDQESGVLLQEQVVEENNTSLSEEVEGLQPKLDSLAEEYTNKEQSLTEQIRRFENKKAELNERIKQLQIDLANSQAEAKQQIKLLPASKIQEIKDAINENSK